MMLKNIKNKLNDIHISIGEEGAAILYFQQSKLVNELFIKNINEQEIAELKKIILSDPDASIHLYLDTLDQSYIQRVLTGVNVFSIDALAKQRLIKEVPKSHLKDLLRVGRTRMVRNDWIYVFVSTAVEPPISDWIKFLEDYPNIIQGIHFLPVELITLLRKITPQLTKVSYKDLFKNLFNKKSSLKILPQVEILLIMTKSSGFRQVIFLNNKIILTRLLSDAYDPNADVIAGNLEKELLNSIEYIRRLTFLQNCEVEISIIVSNDIKKYIRRNKFNVKEVKLFTPSEAAKIVNIDKGAVQHDDKFCDPLILTVLHNNRKRIITTFTPDLEKIYKYTSIFKKINKCIKIFIPLFGLSAFIHVYSIFTSVNDVNTFIKHQTEILSQISTQNDIKNQETSKFGSKANIEQVEQVVEIYDKQGGLINNPLQLLRDIGDVRSDIARVQQIEIQYNTIGLKYNNLTSSTPQTTAPLVQGKFIVVLKNFGNTYEELIANYKDYEHKLITKLANYKVVVSQLPTNFTFDDFKKPISLTINIETKPTTAEVKT